MLDGQLFCRSEISSSPSVSFILFFVPYVIHTIQTHSRFKKRRLMSKVYIQKSRLLQACLRNGPVSSLLAIFFSGCQSELNLKMTDLEN